MTHRQRMPAASTRIGCLLVAFISIWWLGGCGSRHAAPKQEAQPVWASGRNVEPGITGGHASGLSVTAEPAENSVPPEHPNPANGDYRLRRGDVISVKFIHNPELNVDAPIRPDGKIRLPLVGEMPVEGKTLPELHADISRSFKDFVSRTRYGYLLKEGDFLELRFVYNPELNLGVRIRSDGKISLPLLGDVPAAGLEPVELSADLIRRYSRFIANPDVALLIGETTARKVFADEAFIMVGLAKAADQEVFVGGEVVSPKGVRFDGRLTTLQAIMQAGGVKDTGNLGKVVVIRRGQFEAADWIRTDLSKPLSGKSISNDVALRSGDVVIVPRSGIAEVDLFVRQYIRDVLPFQSNFTVSVVPLDAGVP